MHDAEVHVFSDYVLCQGMQAMTMLGIKFSERWKEHLAYCNETAQRIDGEKFQFILKLFLGIKTKKMKLRIDEWIPRRRRLTKIHQKPLCWKDKQGRS